jgi:hypothetical protein
MHRLLAGRRGVSADGCWGRGQESAALAAGVIGLLVAGVIAGCDPGPQTGPGLDPPDRSRGVTHLVPQEAAGGSGSFGNGTQQMPSQTAGAPADEDSETSKDGSGGATAMMGAAGTGSPTGIGTGGASSSGEPPVTEDCPAGVRYPTQLALHVALDESLSMVAPYDSWTPLTAALERWIDAQPDTQLAVQMFASACSGYAYALPTLALAPASDQKGALQARMGESTHDIGAATAPALQSVVARATQWAASGGGNAAVVLISSSEPNACSGQAGESAAMIAAQGLSSTPAVPTYVIALREQATLDGVALAGGTAAARRVTDPRSQDEMLGALQAITDDARCRYALPSDAIAHADQLALELTVDGSVTRVARVASEAECTQVADGFYYDDPAMPRFALACPQTCARGGSVQIAYCP